MTTKRMAIKNRQTRILQAALGNARTYTQIAADNGVSHQEVSRIAVRAGIFRGPRKPQQAPAPSAGGGGASTNEEGQ